MRSIVWRWAGVALGLVAIWAGGVLALNATLYSPGHFVTRYLEAVSEKRWDVAVSMSGAEVDAVSADDGTLTEIAISGQQTAGPDEVFVQADFVLNDEPGQTVFTLVRLPRSLGLFDQWGFATPPTATLLVDSVGAPGVLINNDFLDSAGSHTVLVPGVYTVQAGNQWALSNPAVATLSTPGDTWQASLPLWPTASLRDEVAHALEEYLQQCARQEVLQPASCPFGTEVTDRLVGLPTWTITVLPSLDFALSPDGSTFAVEAVGGVATVTGTLQALFDGSLRPLSRDVPFTISGEVTGLDHDSPALRLD